jgi:hypothetical protein
LCSVKQRAFTLVITAKYESWKDAAESFAEKHPALAVPRTSATHSLLDKNKTQQSFNGDTRRRSWLRHCATSRKIAGSIPDGVIGIFH